MEKFLRAYKELYSSVYDGTKYTDGDLANFSAMRGKHFDANNEFRFMLVGRALNGWNSGMSEENADVYANDAWKRFSDVDRFSTEWKLQNMEMSPYSCYCVDEKDENANNKKVCKKYYLSRSPFWNSAHHIWSALTGQGYSKTPSWFEEIAWSNLYKVSPLKEGNPSSKLCNKQQKACVDILREEIRLFKPTHIMLVVDKSWFMCGEPNFLSAFGDLEAFVDYSYDGSEYAQLAFISNGIKVVVTSRPERKPQGEFVNEVAKAFEKL